MKQEWISVAEKLPDGFENVLVWGRNGVQVARRWTGCNWGQNAAHDDPKRTWDWLTEADRVVLDVTHWAPLPVFARKMAAVT